MDGLHFHTLCEQDSDALEQTLDAVAEKFGDILPRMKWLNFGGGHHITRPGYDIPRLERCIRRAQERWGVTVYLEPGEACALNAGYLLSQVLDVVRNGETTVAILDASAACHMPDVLEMPYLPPLLDAEPDSTAKPCAVRLAGPTCLAGDVIGDYGMDAVPQPGQTPGVWGYGHLHHLQKQHLQRDAAAFHLAAAHRRQPAAPGALWLPGFQDPAGRPA